MSLQLHGWGCSRWVPAGPGVGRGQTGEAWSPISQETVGKAICVCWRLRCHGFCGLWRGAAAMAVGTGVLGSRGLTQAPWRRVLFIIHTQPPPPRGASPGAVCPPWLSLRVIIHHAQRPGSSGTSAPDLSPQPPVQLQLVRLGPTLLSWSMGAPGRAPHRRLPASQGLSRKKPKSRCLGPWQRRGQR